MSFKFKHRNHYFIFIVFNPSPELLSLFAHNTNIVRKEQKQNKILSSVIIITIIIKLNVKKSRNKLWSLNCIEGDSECKRKLETLGLVAIMWTITKRKFQHLIYYSFIICCILILFSEPVFVCVGFFTLSICAWCSLAIHVISIFCFYQKFISTNTHTHTVLTNAHLQTSAKYKCIRNFEWHFMKFQWNVPIV